MKKYFIYKHTNKINGKAYIGQSGMRDYKARANSGEGYKHCQLFYNAIQKYGWDNFEHEILEDNILDPKIADEREIYWIEFYHTFVDDPECNGYNLTKGGDSNKIVSASTRLKFSERMKAEYQSDPEKAKRVTDKMHSAWKGKHHSDDSKQKMSEKALGNKVWLGRHHSEESKRKISEFRKAHPMSDEKRTEIAKLGGSKSKGKKWFNNGERNIRSFDCPEGYVPGRLSWSIAQK